MKLSSVLKGTRLEKPIAIEIAKGVTIKALLRPLSAAEEVDVIADATAYAKAKKVPEPRDGQSIYDAGVWAYTVARAYLDPDSPAEARQPLFEGGALDLLDLHADALALLYEHQQYVQEEASPSVKSKSFQELLAIANEIAAAEGDDYLPFARLSPRTQWNLARFMAVQLVTLRALKSLTSSPDGMSGPSSPSDTPPSDDDVPTNA